MSDRIQDRMDNFGEMCLKCNHARKFHWTVTPYGESVNGNGDYKTICHWDFDFKGRNQRGKGQEEGMRKTIHMSLDIRGALLNWENRMFNNMFKHDDNRPMTAREAKIQLMEELVKGNNYIPYGDCPDFDPKEKGCPGHQQS